MGATGDPATRDSWRQSPPVQPAKIPTPRRSWSDGDWDRIRHGLVPQGPDDAWFVFVEGDRLHLHRSSDGAGIYEARLRRELLGWKIVSAEVESDPEVNRRGTDDEESKALQSLIETLLLKG